MREFHPNTRRLIAIANEAYKLGWYKRHPKVCFESEVAKRAGEEGADYPSNDAIKIAERMLRGMKGGLGRAKA